MGHFSAFAGSVALAVIMFPVVARTTEDIENPAWFIMWLEGGYATYTRVPNYYQGITPRIYWSCGGGENASGADPGYEYGGAIGQVPYGANHNFPPNRHNGSGPVAFCDGHVAVMTPDKLNCKPGNANWDGPWSIKMSDDKNPG